MAPLSSDQTKALHTELKRLNAEYGADNVRAAQEFVTTNLERLAHDVHEDLGEVVVQELPLGESEIIQAEPVDPPDRVMSKQALRDRIPGTTPFTLADSEEIGGDDDVVLEEVPVEDVQPDIPGMGKRNPEIPRPERSRDHEKEDVLWEDVDDLDGIEAVDPIVDDQDEQHIFEKIGDELDELPVESGASTDGRGGFEDEEDIFGQIGAELDQEQQARNVRVDGEQSVVFHDVLDDEFDLNPSNQEPVVFDDLFLLGDDKKKPRVNRIENDDIVD